MTRYSEQQIDTMKKTMLGKKVTDFYYESEGDYFVMVFDDGSETSFRFMADLLVPL